MREAGSQEQGDMGGLRGTHDDLSVGDHHSRIDEVAEDVLRLGGRGTVAPFG